MTCETRRVASPVNRIDAEEPMAQLTKHFGKVENIVPIPHLLDLQVESYQQFLQMDVEKPPSRYGIGGRFSLGLSNRRFQQDCKPRICEL